MLKKNENKQTIGLKTLRLLVEVVESENGYNFTVRTENGAPIAQSSNVGSFLEDLETIVNDFANFNPDHDGK